MYQAKRGSGLKPGNALKTWGLPSHVKICTANYMHVKGTNLGLGLCTMLYETLECSPSCYSCK